MPGKSAYTQNWDKCHKGNVELFTLDQEEKAGTFYVGGWSRDATMMTKMMIIDLTGNKTLQSDIEAKDKLAARAFAGTIKADKQSSSTGILHLYIPDGGVGRFPNKTWGVLANEVLEILSKGTDVLVCCMGGHGRTGIAAAIIAHLIDPEMTGKNPVAWVRDKYCEKVVENQKQIDYIWNILELGNPPKKLKGSKLPWQKSVTHYAGGSSYEPHPNDGKSCPSCKQSYYCAHDCYTKFHEKYQHPQHEQTSMDEWYMQEMDENKNIIDAEFETKGKWNHYMGGSW